MKLFFILLTLCFSTYTYAYSSTLIFTGKIFAPACKVQLVHGELVSFENEKNCVPVSKSAYKYVYKSKDIQAIPSGKIVTVSFY